MNKMEKIEQKIRGINDIEFPEGLYGRIIRSIIIRRYRWPLFSVLGVVVFNVIVSGLRLQSSFAESGATTTFNSFFKGFSMDYNFIQDFSGLVADYIPLHSLAIFLVNLALTGYIAKLYFDTVKYDKYVERSSKLDTIN